MTQYIKEHANVMEVEFEGNFQKLAKVSMKPNIEKLKEIFEDKGKFAMIFPMIKNLTEQQIKEFSQNKVLKIDVVFKG